MAPRRVWSEGVGGGVGRGTWPALAFGASGPWEVWAMEHGPASHLERGGGVGGGVGHGTWPMLAFGASGPWEGVWATEHGSISRFERGGHVSGCG